ncbi:MAG: S-layer homology domain-containing protein [Chloroflexota bacterium]|nr:S-layer homology domain-containing protein [Chloroflexota bacterium]MDQ5866371.1 S-layer homology domain-containing protein [Chloroflexota bacterium]
MHRKLLITIFTIVATFIASALILKTTAYGAAYSPEESKSASKQTPAPSSGSQPEGPSALGSQSEPSVAYNPTATEYLVVWEDSRGTGGDGAVNIQGQRVDADGTMLGENFVIAEAAGAQSEAKVAFSTNAAGYLVVWEDGRSGTSVDIYGQVVSSGGSLVGANFQITTVPFSAELYPDVSYSSSTNEYLVIWSGEVSNTNHDIKGLRISTGGVPQGGVINIMQTSTTELRSALSYNASSAQFLVVADTKPSSGFESDVLGQIVGSNGALSGQTFPVSASVDVRESSPEVAYNSTTQEWLIVWEDNRNGTIDVYGRRVNSSGTLLGSDIGIAVAASIQQGPSVVYNNAAQVYMVAWYDARVQYADIYAQVVHNNGSLSGTNFIVADAANIQHSPDIVDGPGPAFFFAVWTDLRDDDADVFAQRMSNTGQMLGDNFPAAPYPYVPNSPTPTQTTVPTPCSIEYSDVPPGSTFYSFVRCLACRAVLSGYPDGTFKAGNNVTRAQLAKIVTNAAALPAAPSEQIFEDIPPDNGFYDVVQRLAYAGAIGGYPCGSAAGEPCEAPGNRPYFRPGNNATRGQIAKIVSEAAKFSDPPGSQTFQDVPPDNAFFPYVQRLTARNVMGGYACGNGTPGEDCVPPGNLPYFRVGANATRGQVAKIVSNTFFPNCQTP